jgi:integrase
MRSGDPLISVADERKRERIIIRDEELRLLDACDNRYRSHLRPILICALDTGMRRGEILSLKWSDVDFDERVLTIRAFNTRQ